MAAANGMTDISGYDREHLKSPIIDGNETVPTSASRPWAYQYCTMFGFFQTPNPAYPLRSFDLELPYWPEFCKALFDPDLPPTTDGWTNSYFGGLDIPGSNIFFFTASEDPWQYCGMTEIHDPVRQADMKAWHVECEDCSHCVDIATVKPTDA